MSTDATSSPEADFHGRLFAGVRAYLAENPDAAFSDVSIEESVDGRRADVIVEHARGGGLLLQAVGDAVDPRAPDVVARARRCGRDLGTAVFATYNSNDCFLFDSTDEGQPANASEPADADSCYLNLRNGPLAESISSILDAAEHRHREGSLPEQPRRERFVGILQSFHGSTWPAFEAAARDAYGSDRAFTDAFDDWTEANGDRDRDRSEQFEIAAKRYAYLAMARVLADSELVESVPHTETTRRRLADLERTVDDEPIAAIDGNPLGELYEELIPADERTAHGQFYTPPAIAETLVRWALRADDDRRVPDGDGIPRILDPAAGSGAFVVEAYRCLAERFPEASHQELVDHVVAVDVNRFPLQLAALTLASQRRSEPTDHVHAYHASFFDLDPSTGVPAEDLIRGPRDCEDGGEIGPVDAVVGNPPYVEASDLSPDLEHFRAHLREFGPENAAPYEDGRKKIGSNADAYVYFVTHATQFLREGGRLAFIVPTKWMMSRYGEQFQGFLHDHYRIEAVVGFDARAFEDALVDTALVLLEKCSDAAKRRENVVEFVQLHGTVGPETLLGTIDYGTELPADGELTITRAEDFRTVGIRQSTLEDETEYGKIAHYLVAPEDLIELVESPELVELGELADVTRGAMTGSTSFFFPDGEDVDAHGIEEEFLLPALKSMRGYDTIGYDEADVDRWFVDVHDYVEAVRSRSDDLPADESLVETVEGALADDGYDGLLSWIRHAEAEGEHRGATCENREVWFDFGDPPRPEILFQKLLRERLFSIYNRAGAVPSNAVDCIDVHPDVDSKALFGVLNSSVTRAVMEVWGRNEAGMLQLMTYETESLPVPDVRSMSEAERSAIVDVVDDVLERGASELSEAHRDRLDAAVLDALDRSVETSVERIQEIQRFMLGRRVESGETIEVLMGELDVFDGTGTRSVSLRRGGSAEQGTLDDD